MPTTRSGLKVSTNLRTKTPNARVLNDNRNVENATTPRSSKIPTLKKKKPLNKARPMPDFTKKHKEWQTKLDSGKACTKKPLTHCQEFDLTKSSQKFKQVRPDIENDDPQRCEMDLEFASDQAALDSVVNSSGRTQATRGVTANRSGARRNILGEIPVTSSHGRLAGGDNGSNTATLSTFNSLAEQQSQEDLDFEADSGALQSILNNTGIDEFVQPPAPNQTGYRQTIAGFARGTSKAPSGGHTMSKPVVKLRKSIYYNGPTNKSQSSVNAITDKLVKRWTMDPHSKITDPSNNENVEPSAAGHRQSTAGSGKSTFKVPFASPAATRPGVRQSIYYNGPTGKPRTPLRMQQDQRQTVDGNFTKPFFSMSAKKPKTPCGPAQRVLRAVPRSPGKSPAIRVTKTKKAVSVGKALRWADVLKEEDGKQIAVNRHEDDAPQSHDELAMTLFTEDESQYRTPFEDPLQGVIKDEQVPECLPHQPETEDKLKEISEIEKLLEMEIKEMEKKAEAEKFALTPQNPQIVSDPLPEPTAEQLKEIKEMERLLEMEIREIETKALATTQQNSEETCNNSLQNNGVPLPGLKQSPAHEITTMQHFVPESGQYSTPGSKSKFSVVSATTPMSHSVLFHERLSDTHNIRSNGASTQEITRDIVQHTNDNLPTWKTKTDIMGSETAAGRQFEFVSSEGKNNESSVHCHDQAVSNGNKVTLQESFWKFETGITRGETTVDVPFEFVSPNGSNIESSLERRYQATDCGDAWSIQESMSELNQSICDTQHQFDNLQSEAQRLRGSDRRNGPVMSQLQAIQEQQQTLTRLMLDLQRQLAGQQMQLLKHGIGQTIDQSESLNEQVKLKHAPEANVFVTRIHDKLEDLNSQIASVVSNVKVATHNSTQQEDCISKNSKTIYSQSPMNEQPSRTSSSTHVSPAVPQYQLSSTLTPVMSIGPSKAGWSHPVEPVPQGPHTPLMSEATIERQGVRKIGDGAKSLPRIVKPTPMKNLPPLTVHNVNMPSPVDIVSPPIFTALALQSAIETAHPRLSETPRPETPPFPINSHVHLSPRKLSENTIGFMAEDGKSYVRHFLRGEAIENTDSHAETSTAGPRSPVIGSPHSRTRCNLVDHQLDIQKEADFNSGSSRDSVFVEPGFIGAIHSSEFEEETEVKVPAVGVHYQVDIQKEPVFGDSPSSDSSRDSGTGVSGYRRAIDFSEYDAETRVKVVVQKDFEIDDSNVSDTVPKHLNEQRESDTNCSTASGGIEMVAKRSLLANQQIVNASDSRLGDGQDTTTSKIGLTKNSLNSPMLRSDNAENSSQSSGQSLSGSSTNQLMIEYNICANSNNSSLYSCETASTGNSGSIPSIPGVKPGMTRVDQLRHSSPQLLQTSSPEVTVTLNPELKRTPVSVVLAKSKFASQARSATTQRFYDALVDEECALYACRVVTKFTPQPSVDRCFSNPVAKILTEGDEMHFIPVRDDSPRPRPSQDGSAFSCYTDAPY